MRALTRGHLCLKAPCIAYRFYRYPNGNVEDVMRMVQTVSEKRKHKLRWCMDTDNTFGIELFDSETQRWLSHASFFTPDTQITEVDIDRHVEALLTSSVATPTRRLEEKKAHPTVIDFTKQPNVVQMAKAQLCRYFPNLQLQIIHTSGEDLQSRRTHTVSVSLMKVGGSLSATEKKALATFEAEAVGAGFLRTARRALEEAYEKCGLALVTDTPERSKSVLGSYVEVLRSASGVEEGVNVLVVHKNENAVIQVKVSDELCSSVVCEGAVTLAKLLEALKQAADLKCPQLAQQVGTSVETHPLILVLPKERIRVKRVLRELLHYYYSLGEEDILFATNANVQGVFVCSIEAALPFAQLGIQGAAEKVTLARASGLSKSAAEQLAAVLALQVHFSKEYVEQISFHGEVKAILQSRKASSHHDFPPPANKGLKNLLDWALSRTNVQVKLTPLLLQANKAYENFGVKPTVNIWSTTIDVRVGETVKTLVVYDQKKNRCENKAVALTLFSYFSDLCPEGIAFAKEKGFLTETGSSPPCSTLVPLSSNGGGAAPEDKLLSSLQVVPWQTLECPLEEGVCLLEKLRIAARKNDEDASGPATSPLGERVLYDAVKGLFVASLVQEGAQGEEVVCSFSHSNELRCLLSLYVSFAKKHEATAKELTYKVPFALPMNTPLETTVALVMHLYGLHVAVRLTTAQSDLCAVELWGVRKEGEAAKRWMLGRGKGTSLHNAVRAGCVECFDTHVRHLHPPFGGTVCDMADVVLSIQQHSVLAKLMRHVEAELQQTTTEKSISLALKVTANRALPTPFIVHMDAVSDTHSIELEKCSGSKLLSILDELRTNIAAETDDQLAKGTDTSTTKGGGTVVDRLKDRCEKAYGLTVQVETLLYDKQWMSRLSLQLNESYSYALCVSKSHNKKQSVEKACMQVLSLYFDEPLQNVFSDEASVTECNYLCSHIPCTD